MSPVDHHFKICTLADLEELREICIETFTETYQDLNTPENFAAYIKDAFNESQLISELENPNSTYLILYKGIVPAGYLKINVGEAQTDIRDKDAMEIERIYVRKMHQKKGLGKILIDQCIAFGKEKVKEIIWLGVWTKNENAVQFYEKMGFLKSGTHIFQLGDDRQTDYIMKLTIN